MALKNALGGIAFIAGTAVGAAVLALPVACAHLGVWQATTCYLIAWVFMTLGALFLLEVNLCVGYGANLITMARTTIGNFGAFCTWIIYLVLLFTLTAAYLTGADAWLRHVFTPSFALQGPLVAAIITSAVIFLGTTITDWCNRLIMIGLVSSFLLLVFNTMPNIDVTMLTPSQPHFDISVLPLMITAFGFAIIVPTLADYLHGNAKQLCGVLLIGSSIPLLLYLIWQTVIFGTIPVDGEHGLLSMQVMDRPEVDLSRALDKRLGTKLITQAASYFSIFALVSSILGVTLSLFDFLADGLQIKKSLLGKLFLSIVTFLPPLLFLAFYPKGFTQVLSFAGIFVALLLGILPAIMAWRARYVLKLERKSPLFGGKIILTTTILFFTGIIAVEIAHQLGWLAHAG